MTPTSIDQRLATALVHRPAVGEALAAAHEAVWASVDPVLAELTRLRIAMLLGHDAELTSRTTAATAAGLDEATIAELADWPRSLRFDARQRACLDFVEQYLIDVASMSTEQTAAVATHLGDDGLVNFASAVLVLEQRQRLDLTWARVLGANGTKDLR